MANVRALTQWRKMKTLPAATQGRHCKWLNHHIRLAERPRMRRALGLETEGAVKQPVRGQSGSVTAGSDCRPSLKSPQSFGGQRNKLTPVLRPHVPRPPKTSVKVFDGEAEARLAVHLPTLQPTCGSEDREAGEAPASHFVETLLTPHQQHRSFLCG